MKKLALLPFLLLLGCSSAGPRSLATGEKLVVMASTVHLASIALAVAGADAEVQLLPKEGTDPHSFEATTDDRRRLERAHILLVNGLKLETFDAPKLASAARLTLVDCSAKIPESFLIDDDEKGEEHGHEHEHGHAHGDCDPHVWLSTEGATHQANAVASAMSALDPAHAEGYRKRAAEFATRLTQLRDDFKQRFAALANTSFITDHDAFAYFAREFGLRNVGFVRKLPGKEPTLEERRTLEKAIRDTGAKAIFIEPGHDATASEAVAASVGVKLAQLDPFEIGKPFKSAYEDVMRKNLGAVLDAMK